MINGINIMINIIINMINVIINIDNNIVINIIYNNIINITYTNNDNYNNRDRIIIIMNIYNYKIAVDTMSLVYIIINQ